jgi:hypothetical protein
MSQSMISPDRRPRHRADPASSPHPATRPDAHPADDPMPPDAAELEATMAAYKRHSGRPFPTWCEVLEVLKGLGYAKPEARPAPPPRVPRARHRVRIRRGGPELRPIAEILGRYGGVGLGLRADRIYAFPSGVACDAALMMVRSIYGWTSVEPDH